MAPKDKHADRHKLYFRLSVICFLVLWLVSTKFPPDGIQRNTLAQFIGRFHPLLLHIPIGLLMLVPLLEILGAKLRKPYLKQSAGFVLGLATLTTCITSIDGWLLAWSGGYSGVTLANHLLAGTLLTGLSIALYFVRKINTGIIYKSLLCLCLLDLFWTSHLGGSLTHGETFLTEYMPSAIRPLFRIPDTTKKEKPLVADKNKPTFYTQKIVPLFEAKCISCHGSKKIKGKLRLDSYAAIMKGGENGEVIVPWSISKSELYRRITLPADDDEAMPGGGKPPLKIEEIKLIAQWIAAGAAANQPAD